MKNNILILLALTVFAGCSCKQKPSVIDSGQVIGPVDSVIQVDTIIKVDSVIVHNPTPVPTPKPKPVDTIPYNPNEPICCVAVNDTVYTPPLCTDTSTGLCLIKVKGGFTEINKGVNRFGIMATSATSGNIAMSVTQWLHIDGGQQTRYLVSQKQNGNLEIHIKRKKLKWLNDSTAVYIVNPNK